MTWLDPRCALDARDGIEWFMLRKVEVGRVSRDDAGKWYDFGRELAEHAALALLYGAALIGTAEPDPWGLPRVIHTPQGATRYAELNAKLKDRLTVRAAPSPSSLGGETGETAAVNLSSPSEAR